MGGGGQVALLMTGSVMGMLLMRRAGIRSSASHVGTEEPRRILEQLSKAEEAAADQVWAEIEFDCEAAGDGIDNEPLSSSSPLLPSPGETVAALW